MTQTLIEKRDELVKQIRIIDIKMQKEYLTNLQDRYYKRPSSYSKNENEFMRSMKIDNTGMSIETIHIFESVSYNSIRIARGSFQSLNISYEEITEDEFFKAVQTLIPKELLS